MQSGVGGRRVKCEVNKNDNRIEDGNWSSRQGKIDDEGFVLSDN